MKSPSELVEEFHSAFGHPVRKYSESDINEGTDWVFDWIQFRKDLISEEKDELFEALDDGGLEEIAKEACDLLYVVYGLLVSLDSIDIDACFNEVHQSNMSKLDPNGEVVRRPDGKILKGRGYRKANITPFVTKH